MRRMGRNATSKSAGINMPEYNYSSFQANEDPLTLNTRQRNYTLFLFSITTILLFADQNLLAPNLSQIAEEFGFDDDERDKKLGGDIALAFFILGAPASFLVGCAADSKSVSRNILFGLTVLIGEGACFMTYFTTDYTGLYITRALTGFSVGGALPLLSSVLGDLFKPEERNSVMAWVGVGTGIGIALGQGIAGFLGPAFSWRLPFLVVSIPALCVAVVVMTTVVDPVRGGSERDIFLRDGEIESMDDKPSENLVGTTEFGEDENFLENHIEMNELGKEDRNQNVANDCENNCKTRQAMRQLLANPHIETTKELMKTKTVIFIMFQGAPGCIPWGIVNTFLNDYLSVNCGMSVQAATAIILVFGLGNFFGMLLGGAGGDYLYKKDPRYPSLLSGMSAILGCVPLWVLVNTSNVKNGDMSPWLVIRICTAAALSGMGSGVTGPIVKATLQNVTLPHARGQAFALLNTFDDFGRGLGPVFVANLIIALGGRRIAFNVGISGWILCGLLNICTFSTVRPDIEKTRREFVQQYSNSK